MPACRGLILQWAAEPLSLPSGWPGLWAVWMMMTSDEEDSVALGMRLVV